MDAASFGSHAYSKEELVAEMGAAFLCSHAGIEAATLESAASYIDGWIRVLRGDSRLVIQAAAHAQRAADFILGRAAEPERDPRAVERPVVGVEVSVLVGDRAARLESKPGRLDGRADRFCVAPFGQAELDLALDHRLDHVSAIRRRAAGWTSHSRNPNPGAASAGKRIRAAAPFRRTSEAEWLGPQSR